MKYMPSKYRVLDESLAADKDCKAGSIVYKCAMHDYGMARDDSEARGIEHISVTYNPEGDYPFFTIPKNALERIPE